MSSPSWQFILKHKPVQESKKLPVDFQDRIVIEAQIGRRVHFCSIEGAIEQMSDLFFYFKFTCFLFSHAFLN